MHTTTENINAQFMAKWAKSKNIELLPEFEGFKVGDKVTVINGYGLHMTGYEILAIDAIPTSYGGRFYVYTDAYWYPVKIENLIKETEQN